MDEFLTRDVWIGVPTGESWAESRERSPVDEINESLTGDYSGDWVVPSII